MTSRQAYEYFLERLTAVYQDPGEARSVSRIFFEDALGIRHPSPSLRLSPSQLATLDALGRRVFEGEPVQYVLGKADFFGEKFLVSPAVLIPRPETEELVEWAIEAVKSRQTGPEPVRVLDIGTGSGCIPILIKQKCPESEVWAIDVSPEALRLARQNAELHGQEIRFVEMDILEPGKDAFLPLFDAVISNPPYIPLSEKTELSARVRDFEPGLALFVPDADPLIFYRAIGEFSLHHLRPGGFMLVECHYLFAREVEKIWRAQGWKKVAIRQDLSGQERMLMAVNS